MSVKPRTLKFENANYFLNNDLTYAQIMKVVGSNSSKRITDDDAKILLGCGAEYTNATFGTGVVLLVKFTDLISDRNGVRYYKTSAYIKPQADSSSVNSNTNKVEHIIKVAVNNAFEVLRKDKLPLPKSFNISFLMFSEFTDFNDIPADQRPESDRMLVFDSIEFKTEDIEIPESGGAKKRRAKGK